MTDNDGKLVFYTYDPGTKSREISVCDYAVRARERIAALLEEEFAKKTRKFEADFPGMSQSERSRAAWLLIAETPSLFDDFAVMSPQKKGLLGVGELNSLLRSCLNGCIRKYMGSVQNLPDPEMTDHLRRTDSAVEKKRHLSLKYTPYDYPEWEIRIGDRLMCSKNDYTNGIYNGECGMVTGINEMSGSFRVRYPGRKNICTYAAANGRTPDAVPASEYLIPAYAITIHKTQGSEYSTVCLVLGPEHRSSISRNLLYTGVSRARSSLYIITDTCTWKDAMDRNDCPEDKQGGSLACLIRERAAEIKEKTANSGNIEI